MPFSNDPLFFGMQDPKETATLFPAEAFRFQRFIVFLPVALATHRPLTPTALHQEKPLCF